MMYFIRNIFTNTHHLHAVLELTILLPQSSILKPQTILTHTIFNNYPFLAYILYCLNNLKQNYIILIIVK